MYCLLGGERLPIMAGESGDSTHRDFPCLGLTPEGACKPQIVTKEEMSKGRRTEKVIAMEM